MLANICITEHVTVCEFDHYLYHRCNNSVYLTFMLAVHRWPNANVMSTVSQLGQRWANVGLLFGVCYTIIPYVGVYVACGWVFSYIRLQVCE